MWNPLLAYLARRCLVTQQGSGGSRPQLYLEISNKSNRNQFTFTTTCASTRTMHIYDLLEQMVRNNTSQKGRIVTHVSWLFPPVHKPLKHCKITGNENHLPKQFSKRKPSFWCAVDLFHERVHISCRRRVKRFGRISNSVKQPGRSKGALKKKKHLANPLQIRSAKNTQGGNFFKHNIKILPKNSE